MEMSEFTDNVILKSITQFLEYRSEDNQANLLSKQSLLNFPVSLSLIIYLYHKVNYSQNVMDNSKNCSSYHVAKGTEIVTYICSHRRSQAAIPLVELAAHKPPKKDDNLISHCNLQQGNKIYRIYIINIYIAQTNL